MSKVSFEIPASDMERARTFYQSVFGWRIDPLPTIDYMLVNADGRSIDPKDVDGGITARNDIVQAPVLIISVDSVDESSEKLQAAGGTILTPKERVGNFGWSSYARDTEGNVICLWEGIP